MSKKDVYIYPAVFEEEGGGYNVEFPDLEGVFTCGDDLRDALFMAEDVLGLYLYTLEEDNTEIPESGSADGIKIRNNQFIQLIEVYMPQVREEQKNRYI